jgi:predicted ArsR family transcriptional regulator
VIVLAWLGALRACWCSWRRRHCSTPIEAVVALGTELGFEHEADSDGHGRRLRHCSVAATAARSRDIVCALHHGIANAVAAGIDPGERVALEMHDPHAGRCRFTVSVTA